MADKDKNLKKLAVGTGLVAAAGYLAGIMSAPKSGRETRKAIKEASNKSRIEGEKELKKLHTDLSAVIIEAKNKGQALNSQAEVSSKELLQRSIVAKEKLREVISAVHEGDAEDQDLSRAIKNGKIALEHLKDFLSK